MLLCLSAMSIVGLRCFRLLLLMLSFLLYVPLSGCLLCDVEEWSGVLCGG